MQPCKHNLSPCRACSRQKRRPTILNAEGAISWPTLGGDASQDDTAGAVKPKPLTFPQEMGRFADKASATPCVWMPCLLAM